MRAHVQPTLSPRADSAVDRTNPHLFQPLLCQVATGILSEGDIAPPIREVLRHQRNTRVILGEVIDIDLDACRVSVDMIGQRNQIAYDSVIVATGARASRNWGPGVRAPRARA